MTRLSALTLAAIAATTLSSPVLAQTTATSADRGPVSSASGPLDDLTIGGGVTFASDYVPRGFSLNDRHAVVQGYVEASLPITDSLKLFGGVWASSLDKDVQRGGNETDPYVGVTGDLGEGRSWKATYLRITFSDAPIKQDFNEYTVSYTQPIGPIIGTLFVLYDDYAQGDSTLIKATGVYPVPNTAFSLKAGVGYEDGINWHDKVQWSLGASYDFKGVTFSADYVDTNRFLAKTSNPNNNVADGNLVFSVSKSF
jgi:uncharacterized protein (TIGR02001 family)